MQIIHMFNHFGHNYSVKIVVVLFDNSKIFKCTIYITKSIIKFQLTIRFLYFGLSPQLSSYDVFFACVYCGHLSSKSSKWLCEIETFQKLLQKKERPIKSNLPRLGLLHHNRCPKCSNLTRVHGQIDPVCTISLFRPNC